MHKFIYNQFLFHIEFPNFIMSFNNEVNIFRSLDNFVLEAVEYSEAIDTLLILIDNEGSFSLYYDSDTSMFVEVK